MRHESDFGSMLSQRRRRWPSIDPIADLRSVFPWKIMQDAAGTKLMTATNWAVKLRPHQTLRRAALRREMKAGKSLSFTAPRFLTRGAARRPVEPHLIRQN